jgi:hypothetical protein
LCHHRRLAGSSGVSFEGEEIQRRPLWYLGDAMRREKFYFYVTSLLHYKNGTHLCCRLKMDATCTVFLHI